MGSDIWVISPLKAYITVIYSNLKPRSWCVYSFLLLEDRQVTFSYSKTSSCIKQFYHKRKGITKKYKEN